jgi:precorrin-8X/cobalt-precorrin-8 methylmutase
LLGQEIEQESFRIIRAELGPHNFSEAELAIVVRVIHATADFDFVRIIRFHPQAVQAGLAALGQGCTIITDVHMVRVGIASRLLSRLKGQVVCDISHPSIIEQARLEQQTRAALAMRRNAAQIQGGIVAIGNAPTALLEVIRLVREENIRPALIVGVPVGFVNAVESKEALLSLDVPYLTAVGRKGGSTVAVASLNALLKLALEHEADGKPGA